jgi:hypothetical protein
MMPSPPRPAAEFDRETATGLDVFAMRDTHFGLPWRLSDAARRTRSAVPHAASIRNPSHKWSLAFKVGNGCLSFYIFTPPVWDEWQGQYPDEHWLMHGVFRRARGGNIIVRLRCVATAGTNGPSSTRACRHLAAWPCRHIFSGVQYALPNSGSSFF